MPENMRRWLVLALMAVFAVVIVAGIAVGEETETDRVQSLGSRIKCPVCQGEAIADSPSETARAMMEIVAERVADGQTDQEIVEYFTERYGNGVSLDPPFSGRTLVLWLLPFVAAGFGIVMILGRRRKFSDDEMAEPDGAS
ncbi:cytochrome c-type biogenesis protein CcmH [bacterium]|nr:cytochrome c-type biogenesis protein CcmH [bacterium]